MQTNTIIDQPIKDRTIYLNQINHKINEDKKIIFTTDNISYLPVSSSYHQKYSTYSVKIIALLFLAVCANYLIL